MVNGVKLGLHNGYYPKNAELNEKRIEISTSVLMVGTCNLFSWTVVLYSSF